MKKSITGIALGLVIIIAVVWGGGFYGYVTRYDTHTPVWNAKVKWTNQDTLHVDSCFTDSAGYYEKYNQPNGHYHLKATKTINGRQWYDNQQADIVNNNNVQVDFEISPYGIEPPK